MAIPIDKRDKNGELKSSSLISIEAHEVVDYETIHAHMKLTDWEYRNNGVPGISQLKSTVEHLIRQVELDKDDDMASMGGFIVKVRETSVRVYFNIA